MVWGHQVPQNERTCFFSGHVCQNHLRRRVSAGCWHTLNTSLICSSFPLNQRNHRDGRCSGGRPPETETRVGWVPQVHSCGISVWKSGRGSRDGCWWWVLRVARAAELTGVELGEVLLARVALVGHAQGLGSDVHSWGERNQNKQTDTATTMDQHGRGGQFCGLHKLLP